MLIQTILSIISSKYNIIEIIKSKDHHKYSDYDIQKISTKLNGDVSLITTEKDAVKLCEYGELYPAIMYIMYQYY